MAAARFVPYLTGAEQPIIFEQLVLPRLLGALLAGAGLGVGGAILQGLTRNPMASPGLLGVTAGAHLFIVGALVVFDAQLSLVLAGFAGSLVALIVTWFLAGPSGRHGAVLALAGVAVTLAFTAAASALTLLNEQEVGGAFLWSAGAPLMAGWDVLAQLGPWIAAGMALAFTMVRGLDLLALGSVMARSLSASPARLTTIGFAAVGLMAGAAVALTGPVSFIGLVAPNALRRLGVRRHAWLLPASAVWGAVLLVGAGWLVRLLSAGGEGIPVGVVTAVVGAPVFLALIAGLTHGGEATGFGGGRRWGGAGWLGAALWLVVAGLSLSIGHTDLAPVELMRALVSADAEGAFVVRELRLPRLLVASTAGALLALAGAVLQAVLRNPLAGPETLGIVQGAALCSVFALLAGAHPGGWAMQLSALLGGAGAVAVVFAVARRAGMSPVPLVLAGIALASLLSSLAALTVLKADLQATQALVWLSGSVYARGWGDWVALLPATALVAAVVWWLAPSLDLLGLGDTKARALGLAVPTRRALGCCLAALATAASVSVVGSLAFVGLLAPHMARMLSGGCLRPRLPLIVSCGAGLTAVADFAGRTLIAPSQLPAGIMTSLVGAPYFLWLLRSTRRGRA
jgi:iron complex transport system permease protein